MAFFQYRAADQAGKVVEGVMEADAEQSVVSRLREMGCIPLRIAMPSERAVGAARQARPLFEKRKVSQQQLLQFTREMATLLNAGLPLDRSLSILGNLFEGANSVNPCARWSKPCAPANLSLHPWVNIHKFSHVSMST